MKLPEKSKRPGPQRALRYKHMDFSKGSVPGRARKALGSFSYAFPSMPSDKSSTPFLTAFLITWQTSVNCLPEFCESF